MAQKTAQQAQSNWTAAMGSGQTKTNYINGINAVTVNPMQLAAAPEALQKYIDGCQRSLDTGKRAKALNAASVATWKGNATSIGANNLATGAKKAQDKYARNIAPYAAVWPQMRQASKALPSGGIANAQAKANAALAVLMQAAGYTS